MVHTWYRWFPFPPDGGPGGGGGADDELDEPFEWAVIGTAIVLVAIYSMGQVCRGSHNACIRLCDM